MPTDQKESQDVLISAVGGQGDIQTMPQYYVDYDKMKNSLLPHAKKLEAQKELSSEDANTMRLAAKAYGKNPDEVRYLTLASSRKFAVMLVDAQTAAVVGPVNVDP